MPQHDNDMRRKDKQIEDKATIESILAAAQVCRLAMVDGDRPYVVPMCFGYREGALYLHSALQGKKIDVLRNNAQVCFEVDTLLDTIAADKACDWSMRYQSVIGFGKAEFIEDLEEKRIALGLIMSRYTGRVFEFSENAVRVTAVIRVNIESLTGKSSGI